MLVSVFASVRCWCWAAVFIHVEQKHRLTIMWVSDATRPAWRWKDVWSCFWVSPYLAVACVHTSCSSHFWADALIHVCPNYLRCVHAVNKKGTDETDWGRVTCHSNVITGFCLGSVLFWDNKYSVFFTSQNKQVQTFLIILSQIVMEKLKMFPQPHLKVII